MEEFHSASRGRTGSPENTPSADDSCITHFTEKVGCRPVGGYRLVAFGLAVPYPRIRRGLMAETVTLLTLLATALLLAGPAAAHATLLLTSPVAGGSVTPSPKSITLTFDEPVTLRANAARLSDSTRSRITLGRASRGGDDRRRCSRHGARSRCFTS